MLEESRKLSSVCCAGLAEVTHGIDWRAIDANFVVNVRSGRSPADADVTD